MKQLPKTVPALLISIFLCIPSVLAVFSYTWPMEDVTYPLFQYPEDGQEWEDADSWKFYTNEKGAETELTSNGFGGYLGLSYPGQTFYYSRILAEEAQSPMLKIEAVNRTVSVFLDDTLIYTDCQDLDNRIGYLNLPMLEYDRMEPITISLPPDYVGKTLTIAQSSPVVSETLTDAGTVWPSGVTLYCGYAYESSLIASSSKTMLPAALLFALELFLLAAFLWKAFAGHFSLQLPVLALAVLFQMCSVLTRADYFYRYSGNLPFDPTDLLFHLSAGTLLLFLTLYAGRLRPLFLAVTVLHWGSTLLYLVTKLNLFLDYGDWYQFFAELPQITGFLSLLAVLVGAFLLWKMGNRFFRHMAQTALALLVGYALFLAAGIPASTDYAASVFTRIKGDILLCLPNFSLKLVWYLSLISGLAAVILELVEQEAERRTEYQVLEAKNQLAMESYDSLRHQAEQIQLLRHDTMKHYSLLRAMAAQAPDRIPGYLDELIGQAEKIRPVVNSSNRILNIILNGKLSAASEKGISTEILRGDAPETLPLSDTELCCLFMNILDNAINGASGSDTGESYIKLDFHCKDNHFVFTCENSISARCRQNKKSPMQVHGYGLKIIRQIMDRWGENMVSIQQSRYTYRIMIIIPI